MHCDEFATSQDTNAHWSIFLKNYSRVIILNRSRHVHFVQSMINQVKNLQVIYVDTYCNILPVTFSGRPFVLLYTKHLHRFLKDNNMTFDKWKMIFSSIDYVIKFIYNWPHCHQNASMPLT